MSGVLVGGIGNIFLGDDGFGVEVVRRLQARAPVHGVDIVDFGIRSLDLAYALTDAYDEVILIDAMARGDAPGTLYVIEPQAASAGVPTAGLAAHGLVPTQVLQLVASLGRREGRAAPRLRIVGCEPGCILPEGASEGDVHVGLSAAVSAAVQPAVELVESLVRERCGDA